MGEESIGKEALVLGSIQNILSEAVRWTTKNKYTIHHVHVRKVADTTEIRTLSDLIHDFENGGSNPAAAGIRCDVNGEHANGESQTVNETYIATLKYISQLSAKLLKSCSTEQLTQNENDSTDLEANEEEFLSKRVKEEIIQEEAPVLSKDLLQYLNVLEGDQSDAEVTEPVEHGIDNDPASDLPVVKTEYGDVNSVNNNSADNNASAAKKRGRKKGKLGKLTKKAAGRTAETRIDKIFAEYKCFECKDSVDMGDKKSFKSHWETAHVVDIDVGEPKLKCRLCKKIFLVNNNAANFIPQEPGGGTSGRKVTWDVICQYLVHLVISHDVTMPEWVRCYACDVTDCRYVALDEAGLVAHRKLMRYACAECGAHFAMKRRRTSHAISRHSDRSTRGRIRGGRVLSYTQYKCCLCAMASDRAELCESFPDSDGLADHVKEAHAGQTEFRGGARHFLQCVVCLKQIIMESKKTNNYMISRGMAALLHHMVSIHQVPVPSFIEPVKCPDCPRVFVHMDAVLAHGLSHADKTTGLAKRSQCYKCGKFIKVSAMPGHLRTCQVPLEARASFTCPVCSEIFLTRSGMTRHLKAIHTGEHNYLCHLCSNIYKSKYSLQYHMHRVHALRAPGMEIFQCQIPSCTYNSIKPRDIRSHERRVHNIGQPPAECDICGKKVKQRYLKTHRLLHNKLPRDVPPALPKPEEAALAEPCVVYAMPISDSDVTASAEIEVTSHQEQPEQELDIALHMQHPGALAKLGLQTVYQYIE